jgi:hypothetical protein
MANPNWRGRLLLAVWQICNKPINHRVAHYEGNIGPLVEMKLDNDMSLFKFDALGDPPNHFATINPQAGGKPQVPDGAVLVASGRIFIEGEQVLCAATRDS